ncbi:unnamed protein product [Microthlaspi erraticum]|uniref:F-box domain-containing protein n=1 Tax=Microthlaspi erraticum TaxID=1685480 RepID=A0A6D2HLW8_9BRAS|nr:unnamed protein product [Microthlaspi erraticum]
MIVTFEEVEPTEKVIPQSPSSFSSLPDEITEMILARVSRWNYPSLSLVSKSFHALLSSMQIYKTRSQIGAEETCFYVCLEFDNQPYLSWFSLWSKPNQTLTKQTGEIRFKQDSRGNSVVPAPFASSHSPRITWQSTQTFGSEIYVIGGPDDQPSSSVRIFDCRSHIWRDAPSMSVARENACALFVNEEIYVLGGCDIDENSANWFEVFDLKTQTWTALPCPGVDDEELRNILREYNDNLIILDAFQGKLYVAVVGEKEYAYEPKDGTWKFVKEQLSLPLYSVSAWYEIKHVVYCCTFSGKLMWSVSKTEGKEWRKIKGLRELRNDSTRGLRTGNRFVLGDDSGKLLVLWDVSDTEQRKNKIWYAKISLESRCNGCEVWGTVDCVDELTFPCENYKMFHVLSASV